MGGKTVIDTSDIARAIERSNQLAMANNQKMMELMKESSESHKKEMELLYKQINESKEQSMKIMEGLRKDQKEKITKYEEEKKEKKKLKELKQKQANNQLISETNLSKAFILKECEEEFDKIKDIYCIEEINNMNISNEIEELFYQLYESENIKDIFLKELLKQIKLFKFNNKINCYNIQIIGNTGVGKSTLINSLLRVDLAKTCVGSVGTLKTEEYSSDKFPFIKFIDTRGTELDSANDITKVKENTLNYIEEKLSEKDPNKTIHCLFYCLTGNRFEGIVADLLLTLRKKYKNGNLPIIIVYTQNSDDILFEQMKSYINEQLRANSETEISDNVEDINIVGVLAKKKIISIRNITIPIKPFGLDKLLTFVKFKAKHSFIIATINMIKKYCLDYAKLLLEKNLTRILKNIDNFVSSENDENTILYNTLKNIFIQFIPKEYLNLTMNGDQNIKNAVKILTNKINDIQIKQLALFAAEASEKIGAQVEKTQYNIICQNSGVTLNNLKEYSQYKNEGKNELQKKLEIKSNIYAKINFAKYLYEKAASKFKILFKESIEQIIEEDNEINYLIKNLNNNISEDITNKIDKLIEELKKYQDGEID